MVELPETQWALLMPDGQVVLGAGDGPSGNVCGLMRDAIAAMFCFAELPRLFICGPALVKCAADFDMEKGFTQRVWQFVSSDGDDWRLFVWSSGSIIALGRTQEEVGAAVRAIQTACQERGAHGRNLLRHPR